VAVVEHVEQRGIAVGLNDAGGFRAALDAHERPGSGLDVVEIAALDLARVTVVVWAVFGRAGRRHTGGSDGEDEAEDGPSDESFHRFPFQMPMSAAASHSSKSE
jgi:hypothetical protein